MKQVGRELGVRYVLEGAIRKAGNRVRISAQLIDATTGAHLWADRFDGSLEDIFELQDQVAASVAGVIEPTLQAAETARSADRPTHDLTAFDLYLRALQHFDAFEKDEPPPSARPARAGDRTRSGLRPGSRLGGPLPPGLEVNGWTEDPEAARRTSIDLARRALRSSSERPRRARHSRLSSSAISARTSMSHSG